MAPKKKVMALVTLQIRAGQATPAPPVGTALGQHGVNIMEFCKQYNDATQQFAGQVIPAVLTIYEDRTFTLRAEAAADVRTDQAGGRHREGVGRPQPGEGRHPVVAQVRQIAERKMPDLNANDVDAAMSIVAGTARSMGVEVER